MPTDDTTRSGSFRIVSVDAEFETALINYASGAMRHVVMGLPSLPPERDAGRCDRCGGPLVLHDDHFDYSCSITDQKTTVVERVCADCARAAVEAVTGRTAPE